MSVEKEKPVALKVIPENIPEELKKIPHWTLWNYRLLNNGTYDKPPLQPSGKYADVSKPETWSTFEEVTKALPWFDGIGFVLTEGLNIIGIDIDKLNEYPDIAPEILDDVETLGTYYERSPSGNGIRAFVKVATDLSEHNEAPFEIFNKSKVLSVTGNMLGTQKSVIRASKAFTYFYRKWVLDRNPVTAPTTQKSKGNCEPGKYKPSPDMSDDEIITKAKAADKSGKFQRLFFEGDMSDYPGTGNSPYDESRAECGLMGKIVGYTQKEEQAIRLMKKSALYTRDRKEKWDREDYLPRTFNFVLSGLTWTFQFTEEKKKGTKKESNDSEKGDSEESDSNRLFDKDGNIIIPTHINNLLNEAEKRETKGFSACLDWIKENAVVLAALNKAFWNEQNIGKKNDPIIMPPDLVIHIGIVFKLESDEYNDIYPILKKNNQIYHSAVQKLRKVRTALVLYPEEVKEQAIQELIEGDPYKYIVETWQQKHMGDLGTGKILPLCAISTLILGDNSGLHFKQSGDSGKGKTSGIDAFLKLIPPSMVIRGSISDKYVYYSPEEDIRDGSIIFIDDRDLSDSLKGVVKTAVSNFQNPEPHRTVIDGKGCVYTPARRLTWLFASVDGFDDEQLSNRFLMADVDCSREQDDAVADGQRKAEGALFTKTDFRVEVCKCIFDILRMRNYTVKIPYTEALRWHNPENRRNQPKFFDIIRAVCAFKVYQRDKINDFIIAKKEDLERAEEIYEYTVKQTKSNLTEKEQKILNLLCNWNEDTGINSDAEDFKGNPSHKNAYKASIKDIAEALDLPSESLRYTVEGKPQKGIMGLQHRVKGLNKDIGEDNGHKTTFYSYAKRRGTFDDLNVFVSYKDHDIERETNSFIEKLTSWEIPISIETVIERQAFLNISEITEHLRTHCSEQFFKKVEDIFNISKDYTNISNNIYNTSQNNLEKRMLEEKEGLDCRKLESEQSDFLQSKSHEYIQTGLDFPEICSERQKNESTDGENISENQIQACSEHSVRIGNDVFVSPTDSENISEHLRISPEMEELLAQHAAKEAYAQKQDFIITPENQQLHEENLHQISLIPDPTELDRFYLHVEGIDIQEIPTEEEERRFAGFKSDCLELEKVGKLNPLNRANEMQELFNIWDHAIHACESYKGKLTLNEILDRRFKDLQHRWLGCFFIERAMERGEVQVCSA